MCSNFLGVTDPQRLLQYFNASTDGTPAPPDDTYPGQFSPMLIRATGPDPTAPPLKAVDAIFRFVPDFVAKLEWARNTFNARGEEVQRKRTYQGAWATGRRCIIPVECVYEPNYENGTYERWRIWQPGYVPMGIGSSPAANPRPSAAGSPNWARHRALATTRPCPPARPTADAPGLAAA
jgi:putative SOS response-associated peptidase YedK